MEKVLNWIKAKWYIIVAAVVAIIVVIVTITSIAGAKTKAVKDFIKAYSKGDVNKIIKTMDVKGFMAWYDLDLDDIKDFEKENYDEFIENYEEIEDEEVEEEIEDYKEEFEEVFDEFSSNYESFKFSIKEIKKVEKLGKNLYAVKAKICFEIEDEDGDKKSDTETTTFVTYKNKIVAFGDDLWF